MSEPSIPPINYTNRDFETIIASFQAHLKTKFPDDWSDFYTSGIGQAIQDLIGFAFDVLSFQIDYTANEMYLPTARDRQSVLMLGRLVGYSLRTPTSASVVCNGTIAGAYPNDIIIPANTVIASNSSVQFYTLADQRIASGQLTAEITVVQGVRNTTAFVSDGTPYQSFDLPSNPVVEDTIEIIVDGNTWAQYVSLSYIDGATKGFSVNYSEDNIATLLFGNGDNGMVPPNGSTINVVYRTGGGISGNIPINDIDTNIQGYEEFSAPVNWVQVVLINNTNAGSGGEDEETVTHAKLFIPKWIRTNNRAVTEDDYDTLGNIFSDPTYGAPAYTKAMLKQEIPELNTVEVACLTGDTEITLYDGTARTIAELAANQKEPFIVCGYDLTKKELVPAKAFNARKTKETNELIEVTLENKKSIRCTPDHLVLMQNGTYKAAELLKIGDLLIPYEVKSVRRLSVENVPVYDLSVEKYHNFALSNGMFVHNCWGRDSVGDITTASVGLKSAIEDYFNNDGVGAVKMLCQHCEVIDGQILYVEIDISIALLASFTETQIRNDVLTAINNIFDSGGMTPGVDFRISNLYNTVQSVAGVAYSIVNSICLSKKAEDIVGFGNGILTTFNHTFDLESGFFVVGGSARFYYGAEVGVLTDDGDGNIINTLGTTVGSIDYDTGVCTFTFAAAPGAFVTVYAECRYVIDYQRGELELTSDGSTARMQGQVDYPPINPFNPTTSVKGIAFSIGSQSAAGALSVLDDGNGNLVGDVNSYTGVNKIDYTSGAYDFMFNSIPPNGVGVYSTYRQILKTPSQDLPVDKSQICVEGDVTITVISND